MLYLVINPQSSDAAASGWSLGHRYSLSYGSVEEAELWTVDESIEEMTHTGTAMDNGAVESTVKLQDIIDAASKLFVSHEYSGAFAVVDSDKLAHLQLLLRSIGEDV